MKKNILIVYASNSGGTFLSAEAIYKTLSKENNVVMQKASDTNPDDLQNYDVFVFGSPSWRIPGMGDGLPHETMLALLSKCRGRKFPDKKFAVFGCGDSFYTFFCGAVTNLENFVASVGGKRIIDSLRIDGYFFELEKNEQLVKQWATQLNEKISLIIP